MTIMDEPYRISPEAGPVGPGRRGFEYGYGQGGHVAFGSALETLAYWVARNRGARVNNLVPLPVIRSVLHGDDLGLRLDLTRVDRLNDGTEIDFVQVYGTAFYGPCPFESDEVELTAESFDHRHESGCRARRT